MDSIDNRWPRRRDLVTILLLMVGGFIPLAIGWVVGVVMLWRSVTWTVREKLLGTVVVPTGLALPVFVAGLGVSGGTCSGHGGPTIATVATCQGNTATTEIGLVVLVVIALAQIISSGILFLAARRGSADRAPAY